MVPPTTGRGQAEEDKHQQEEIRVLHTASMHGRTDVIKVGGSTEAGRDNAKESERQRSR
jgi:heptaprenylglyceryl phosphate synthase